MSVPGMWESSTTMILITSVTFNPFQLLGEAALIGNSIKGSHILGCQAQPVVKSLHRICHKLQKARLH